MIKGVIKKKLLLRIFLIFLLIPFWIFLRHVYRDRIPAFGCFDDCFNYMGGYFLLAGKRLFSEIFFNHQPLPAYMSAAIQFFGKPDGIYLLIHQHRMFIIYFSFIADALLVFRFGLVGLGFAVLFESTKGFLFGEHFLAESMIVYPLVYLLGMIGEIWRRRNISAIELVVVAIFTWFVVFSREPYIPLALAMFGYLLWKHKWNRISLSIFLLMSAVSIGLHSISDYFFNIITVNVSRPGSEGNIWQIIFYPVLIFFGGTWNMFRIVEVSLALVFWTLVGVIIKKKPLQIAILFIFLSLANVRPTSPGEIYYAAFHHLQWYGLFIMSVLLLLAFARGPLAKGVSIAFFGITAWALLNPQSYLYEKVDRQVEFMTNFDRIFVIGGMVNILSIPQDTLFLDGWDDLIYFQAQRHSPYKYSWYTSSMGQFERFAKAREEMFAINPPTFYYGKCVKDVVEPFPKMNDYVRLTTSKAPTCVFVHKSKIFGVSDVQWTFAKERFDMQKPNVTMF
ncbi:hypothetical protein HYV22_01540 [Candidatus Gottesmanbacteria bacterium]|nr:hypothetical protein [Candidatus Gottesmanbacteria bacterium]